MSDSVFFKHRYITQTVITPADAIIKALSDVKTALTGKQNQITQVAVDGLPQVQITLKPNNRFASTIALLQW